MILTILSLYFHYLSPLYPYSIYTQFDDSQRQVRRYLAEGKVKSYEQGELVVKLLEKVF